MSSKPSTRERILQASLELFNSQGERCVTTNHIAAHLGMSPGNLYYHFRNKQMIIAELFGAYEAQVDDFLRLPEARQLTVEDKTLYLEALLAAMWQYRFLHRDLEHLLVADEQLAGRYRQFAQRSLDNAQMIYQGFVEAGVLQMSAGQIETLAINAWIILTSWVQFLCTVGAGSNAPLSQDMLRRGIFQVLALEEGFVTVAAKPQVQMLLEQLHVPLAFE